MLKNNPETMSLERKRAFAIENDRGNFEFAKAVSLAVAIFHIPLLFLDIHRYFFDRELFFKPGFYHVSLIHAIFLFVLFGLFIVGNVYQKKQGESNMAPCFTKTYWRVFLYVAMSYALFTTVPCHLMHGNTTTFFITILGIASAVKMKPLEFIITFVTLAVVTIFSVSFVASGTAFTGYVLDFSIATFISIFINIVIYKRAVVSFNHRMNFETEHDEKIIANEANKAKTAFLANMSHEIRTPLSGIMGMHALINETNLNEEQAEYLHYAKSSAETLLEIINDVLDLSVIDSGNVSIENNPYNFKKTVTDAVENAKSFLQKDDVSISLVFDPQIPETLSGDKTRITQVLNNFLSNAAKFTEVGEIKIICRKNDDMLCVSVSDSGIGIPDDKTEFIFEKFTQIDSSFKKKYKGAGLGLSISKKLIEMMDGQISVKSNFPEKGTTFSFKVPLISSSSDVYNSAEIKLSEKCLLGKKILLAEDNPVNKELVNRYLEKEGCTVKNVGNGLEALELYKVERFDAVLIDIQMPIMDGIQATKKIREFEAVNGIRTPIIAMTAYAMKSDREKFLSAGMDGYISKPFSKEFLIKEICAKTS